MAYQVTMPQMGYDMTEGSINRWLVEEGATVERGDVIASIATEKADIDIEAYASGVLRKILVQPGSKVPVGQAIAIISDPAEEVSETPPAADSPPPGGAPRATGTPPSDEDKAGRPDRTREGKVKAEPQDQTSAETTPVPDWAQQLTGHSQEPVPAARSVAAGGRVKASPLARRRARELGIQLESVRATGPEGRIKAEDVEAASRGGVSAPASRPVGVAQPIDPGDPSEPLNLSRMREAIARRMAESNSTIPHFHLTTEVQMGALLALRLELNQLGDAELPKFSVTDFIVRAMALTLQRHPSLNAAWVGQGVRRFSQSNIALAVAVPDGLVAPVLRGCEALTFAALSHQTHDLAARAKTGKLRPEELSGGHTAISNLGMFGVTQFSAIITPGQGSVLAVGEVRQVPVVVDGQLAPGHQMVMTLAIDHRVTDGAQGAEALAYLRWLLEHPTSCLV
ncbi:MAG TPA: dihydrolipoamide acetyltransferase family protein [Candidatus Nanopelagicaceae bacterium]|nr:dihydrolipoamide acetyltransferase family protein [Candidatus Nanopelagicaceae bacterium]